MGRRLQRIIAFILTGTLALSTACTSASSSAKNTETATNNSTADESESASNDTTSEVNSDSYEARLFDTSYVHTIDIEISDEDWADLLENPTEKTKYKVNVTIDGETTNNVSFATKGNTSLSSIASDDSTDRYSFKINFGKYVDGQTYYGLDKLNLNNIYADSTYMKDYLSYQLFNYMGVDAPLTSFISVTINGEAWGLYLAIEDVSDSFLERTDNSDGELYKPETASLDNAGMDKKDMPEGFDPDNLPEDFDPENMPEDFTPENMPEDFTPGKKPGESSEDGSDENSENDSTDSSDGSDAENKAKAGKQGFGGGPGGFGGEDTGASLKYTDDETDSYSAIFDNAETDVTDADKARLIESLKNLSEGNVEESVNIDSVINYFAVHNFVMNYDSYTGNMLHNYYLYEENGVLQMIPWDYNLAYGAFMNMGGKGGKDENGAPGNMSETSATEIVNYGIDSPLSGASEEDRPMWAWIANNEEYLEQYHESLEKLTSYILSDEFSSEMDRVYEMLLPYVQDDATAFYTADEFTTGFNTLKEFVTLRAESIKKQLSGELATVTDEQNEADRVDAGSITISDMGTQGGGNPGDRQKNQQEEKQEDKNKDNNA